MGLILRLSENLLLQVQPPLKALLSLIIFQGHDLGSCLILHGLSIDLLHQVLA